LLGSADDLGGSVANSHLTSHRESAISESLRHATQVLSRLGLSVLDRRLEEMGGLVPLHILRQVHDVQQGDLGA
jgi:hypothetical protein